MRLDLFLKITGVVKKRSNSNRMIKEGCIFLNGLPTKPSKQVNIGDVIEISGKKFIVKDIPQCKNIKKEDIINYIGYL